MVVLADYSPIRIVRPARSVQEQSRFSRYALLGEAEGVYYHDYDYHVYDYHIFDKLFVYMKINAYLCSRQ